MVYWTFVRILGSIEILRIEKRTGNTGKTALYETISINLENFVADPVFSDSSFPRCCAHKSSTERSEPVN